jgi:hypothetical protein
MRGDLQFYLAPASQASWIPTFFEYIDILFVSPFCLIYAKLLKGRYDAPVLLNFVLAIVAFVAVDYGTNIATQGIRNAIVQKTPTCYETAVQTAAHTYNSDVLGPQIADHINSKLLDVVGTNRPHVSWKDGAYRIEVITNAEQPMQLLSLMVDIKKLVYCANNTGFPMVRIIGTPVHLRVLRSDRSVVRERVLDPSDCRS